MRNHNVGWHEPIDACWYLKDCLWWNVFRPSQKRAVEIAQGILTLSEPAIVIIRLPSAGGINLEKRSAILECSGELSRDEADRQASHEVTEEFKKAYWG